MQTLTAAVVGTGDPDRTDGVGIADLHGRAYRAADGCDLVACCDLVRAHADRFAGAFGVPDANVYEDYLTMLAAVEPDVVSVCTPVPTHADIVVDCAESGVPDAIHCEKPMADTWGDARRAAAACERAGVRLTYNHQRRFSRVFRRAKALLDAGEIGTLERVETNTGPLLDSGTHRIDLCHYLLDQTPVEWVLGNLDYREENVLFGAHNANDALGVWRYENGVHAVAAGGVPGEAVGCFFRLRGSEGVVEVDHADQPLRMRRAGEEDWEAVDVGGDGIHGGVYVERAIADVLATLRAGRESELRAGNALQATEVIFAVRESARRRGRVDLPLEIEDDPLAAMVEAGDLRPAGGE